MRLGICLLLLAGCGSPFTAAGPDLLERADGAPDAQTDGGASEPDGGGEQDGRADAGEAQVDAPAETPDACPALHAPGQFEMWEVSADGGLLASSPSDCQGFTTPAGATYSCASILTKWRCPDQSTGAPSNVVWCRVVGGIVVVGCDGY